MKNHQMVQLFGVSTRSGAERTPKMLLCKSSGQYHSSCSNGSLVFRQSKVDKVNKFKGKMEHLTTGIQELVSRKLRLGAKILQAGGMDKVFKHQFILRDEEKLLKVSQCYLSTTIGPIAGFLFITTEKVAFCSEKSIKINSPNGDLIRIRYKVSIPIEKIFEANEGHNMKRPSQKYIQLVTADNFEFWLMGFLSYGKTLKHLRNVILKSQ